MLLVVTGSSGGKHMNVPITATKSGERMLQT